MNKKLIITSFEEFGSRSINASREVVKALDSKIEHLDIDKRELKVSWNDIENEIDAILNENLDYLILCGEAASYENVKIEIRGTNQCKGKDNYNVEKISEKTDELYTKFDYENLVVTNTTISDNAGSYLCNRSYYLSLLKTKNLKCKVLFIHFPLIKEQEGKWDKDVLVSILKEILLKVKEM